jgi:ribose transport system substrate-binding protein
MKFTFKYHFVSLLFVLVFLMGCDQQKDNPTDEQKKVAVVISTLNNPWFVVLSETAANRARDLGYEATIFDSQNNTALETDHFENAIASGFDAILFNPTDADGSVANVRMAKKVGIPVFCIDREVNATDVATSQILSDSYAGCVAIGKYFVEKLNKQGKYVEILGMVGDNNTWSRSKGFHSVLDHYPELVMVAQQSADFDRNKALEVMESILQVHPDIRGVFCGNDAMAMGVYQALVAAGKEDEVMVFGFDGANDVVNSIQKKKIMATGMQFPKLMARTAADFAHEYFEGKRDFAQKIPVSVEIVHQENAYRYFAYGSE